MMALSLGAPSFVVRIHFYAVRPRDEVLLLLRLLVLPSYGCWLLGQSLGFLYQN